MFVAFTPLSYLAWFRPVYKAFRDDSSISFMSFFFVFFFQMLVSILRMLGWGSGSSGLILGFETVSAGASGGKIFVGILMIIDGVGFGIAALADFYVLTRVRIIHSIFNFVCTHYSKSQIFVQKFNFDKTTTFSRVFHPNFFLTIFLAKSKLSTVK